MEVSSFLHSGGCAGPALLTPQRTNRLEEGLAGLEE